MITDEPIFAKYEVESVSQKKCWKYIHLRNGPTLTIRANKISGLVDKLQGGEVEIDIIRWPPKKEGDLRIHYDRVQIYPLNGKPMHSYYNYEDNFEC